MELDRILESRFSARAFQQRPVPRETIGRILELAQRSASWCNTQPWRVTLVSGDALEKFRAALYAHAASGAPADPDFAFPEKYVGEARARRIRCAAQLYGALGIAREDRAGAQAQALENFRMFGAPHVALVTTEDFLGFWGGVDCGIYLAGFTLAARSLGVDSILQAALASYAGFTREWFGLPPQAKLVAGISFGYADAAHPANGFRTERAAPAEAARWVE